MKLPGEINANCLHIWQHYPYKKILPFFQRSTKIGESSLLQIVRNSLWPRFSVNVSMCVLMVRLSRSPCKKKPFEVISFGEKIGKVWFFDIFPPKFSGEKHPKKNMLSFLISPFCVIVSWESVHQWFKSSKVFKRFNNETHAKTKRYSFRLFLLKFPPKLSRSKSVIFWLMRYQVVSLPHWFH